MNAFLDRVEKNGILRRVLAKGEGLSVRGVFTPGRHQLRVIRVEGAPSPEAFSLQLDHLTARYRPVSLEEVIGGLGMWFRLRPRSVLLTIRTSSREFVDRLSPLFHGGQIPVLVLIPSSDLTRSRESVQSLLATGARIGLDLTGLLKSDSPAEELRRALELLDGEIPAAIRAVFLSREAPASLRQSLRSLGIELGICNRVGINDLRQVDRRSLRSIPLRGDEEVELLRSKLVSCSARLGRWVAPRTKTERSDQREVRRQRKKIRLVYRSLDAALSGEMAQMKGVQNKGVQKREMGETLRSLTRRRGPYFERMHDLSGVVSRTVPALGRTLRRRLLKTDRLPWCVESLRYVGHGTASTVYRLEIAGQPPRVLKVSRWTAWQSPEIQLQHARHHRSRERKLREWFGDVVIPSHFLLIEGPLRRAPVLATLQDEVTDPVDVLALDDDALCADLEREPDLRDSFLRVAERCLALAPRGRFPDLVGTGNLIAGGLRGRRGLWIIDSGIYDRRANDPVYPDAKIDRTVRRFEQLLSRLSRETT